MRPRICISDRFPDTADTTLKIHTLRTTALINISIFVQSISLVQLFMTPRTVARQPPLSWDFPGKNTGMDCHSILQGIFLTQGLNPRLLHHLHWQADSNTVSPKNCSPSLTFWPSLAPNSSLQVLPAALGHVVVCLLQKLGQWVACLFRLYNKGGDSVSQEVLF